MPCNDIKKQGRQKDRRHDSPIPHDGLLPRIPHANGDGKYVIQDAAYDSCVNCTTICNGSRISVILPRGRYTVRGFNARARMLRWFEADRDGFE